MHRRHGRCKKIMADAISTNFRCLNKAMEMTRCSGAITIHHFSTGAPAYVQKHLEKQAQLGKHTSKQERKMPTSDGSPALATCPC